MGKAARRELAPGRPWRLVSFVPRAGMRVAEIDTGNPHRQIGAVNRFGSHSPPLAAYHKTRRDCVSDTPPHGAGYFIR